MPVWFRVLFYACLGVAAEIVFTAFCAKIGLRLTPDLDDAPARRSWRLKGHSFVWMFPIYGLGLLGFEHVHDSLRSAPWMMRGLTYVAALFVIEYVSAVLLMAVTGGRVWRWIGPGAIHGHIHLAMAPVWFAAALALEPLHDILVR